MKTCIAKVSDDTVAIQGFLENIKNGETVTYEQISEGSGIKMTLEGKQKLRSALRRSKREYSPIKGVGIKLACPEMVMPILTNRIVRIDNAVKRADRSHRTLQSQFFDSLNNEQQKQILFAGAVFGAIRVAAENGKMIYQKKQNQVTSTVRIPIPDISSNKL